MTKAATKKVTLKPKAAPLHKTPRNKKPAKSEAPPTPSTTPASLAPAASNKQSQLIELLQRPDGTSLQELMHVTGWQAHSIRGIISGVLRKKLGLVVVLAKNEAGERRYRIQSNNVEAGGHASAAVAA